MDFGAGGGAVGAMGNHGANVDMMSWCVGQWDLRLRFFLCDIFLTICVFVSLYVLLRFAGTWKSR
jgi:hypothetical protein